jgi:hypothetical protein
MRQKHMCVNKELKYCARILFLVWGGGGGGCMVDNADLNVKICASFNRNNQAYVSS